MAIGRKHRVEIDLNIKQYETAFTDMKTGKDLDNPKEKLISESKRNGIDPLQAIKLIIDILETISNQYI